ncbi:MAG: flavodoxin, partial [Chloroflexota bacterium]
MFRFEEDTQFLVVYTGSRHATSDDYRDFIARWSARLAQTEHFGVIMVSEPHLHTEEDGDGREHEAEITRLINDFRRDYREQTTRLNLGFGRVYAAEIIENYFPDVTTWEQAQAGLDRYARYNWAIPGRGFAHLLEAKAWLREQISQTPVATTTETIPLKSSQRVGLFYGSSTGVTEMVAYQIRDAWAVLGMEPITPINIGEVKDLAVLLNYDCLILGTSTWNIGQLQDDWEIVFTQLDALDFSGKQIALFGIGDQYAYPDNFIDAVGILGEKLVERGGELIGFWDSDGYEFSESAALVEDRFMGLAIDDSR